jgi:hypothetical protein
VETSCLDKKQMPDEETSIPNAAKLLVRSSLPVAFWTGVIMSGLRNG